MVTGESMPVTKRAGRRRHRRHRQPDRRSSSCAPRRSVATRCSPASSQMVADAQRSPRADPAARRPGRRRLRAGRHRGRRRSRSSSGRSSAPTRGWPTRSSSPSRCSSSPAPARWGWRRRCRSWSGVGRGASARRADQERRGARADGEGRHARRRQDRHAHRGPARRHPIVPAAGVRRRRGAAAGGGRRARVASTRWPSAIVARRGPGRADRSRRSPTSTRPSGRASSGSSTAAASLVGSAAFLVAERVDPDRARDAEADRLRADGASVGLRRGRRQARRPSSPSPTRSRRPPPAALEALRADGIDVVMLTGDNRGHGATPSPAPSASTASRPRSCPSTRARS